MIPSLPSRRSRTSTGAVLVLALLATACGSQAPVQLDVAPAGATETEDATPPVEVTPSPEATVSEDADPVEDEVVDREEAPAEPVPPGTSARPSPLPADPELVIGDDGCVTDVATGLVVTCHDPAAGPDEG